jgi:hypothetical protein
LSRNWSGWKLPTDSQRDLDEEAKLVSQFGHDDVQGDAQGKVKLNPIVIGSHGGDHTIEAVKR